MEKHGHLQLETSVRDLLLQMSAATMERLLAEPRERVTGTRRRRGVGATLLRRSIPIRTFGDWKDPEAGYMEADLVAHCGGWMAGSVVHTLLLTDVATGWTECVPLIARDQVLIVEALEQVRKALPFPCEGSTRITTVRSSIKRSSTTASEQGWSLHDRGPIERMTKRGWNKRMARWFGSWPDTIGSLE